MIGIISLIATMVIAVVFINQYAYPGMFTGLEKEEWRRRELSGRPWGPEPTRVPNVSNPRSLEFRVKDGLVRIELTGEFERLQRVMREFSGTPVEDGIRKYLADIVPRMLDEAAGQAKGYRG